MRADELLILDYGDLSTHATDLFERLDNSRAFRELFIKDPTGAVGRVLLPGYSRPPVVHINQANRVLFSLLSNESFREWSRRYQETFVEDARQRFPDQEHPEALRSFLAGYDVREMYQELVDGALQFLDREFLYSLLSIDLDHTPPRVPSFVAQDDEEMPAASPVVVAVAVAVFAAIVAVAFLVVGPVVEPESDDGLSRDSLQRVSDMIAESLIARAEELRNAGALTSFDSVQKGPVL